jgi:hypothetical protein
MRVFDVVDMIFGIYGSVYLKFSFHSVAKTRWRKGWDTFGEWFLLDFFSGNVGFGASHN